MSDLLIDLPSHLRDRLAGALESGLLGPSPTTASLRSVLGNQEDAEGLAAALLELERLGISGPAAAAWLRTVARVAERARQPDLVWSGPEVPGLHARDTRRVYEELLGSAEHSICASTYAFFDGHKAFEVLARRMEARPALRVTLLLNIQRKRADTTASDQLVRRFADRFWKTDWPGSSRPSVFYDPRALEQEGPGGVLHAKAVVADDEAVFITSANLTEAALDRNIELGVLIRDRALALTISGYFRNLIDRDLLKPLPSA
jgi:phosphatidylserine/phosphatidylglycerophosphate/cardiolipin synthase-like enzyme